MNKFYKECPTCDGDGCCYCGMTGQARDYDAEEDYGEHLDDVERDEPMDLDDVSRDP